MKVDTAFQNSCPPSHSLSSFLVLQSTKDGMTYLRRFGSIEPRVLALPYGTTNARPTVYVEDS